MSRSVRRSLLSVTVMATLAAAALGGSVVGRAQPPKTTSTPPDVLSALLTEVRGLRAAMEQMASAGARVQLALGRLQLQEQRVNNLVRRLEVVKASLSDAQRGLEGTERRMKGLDAWSRESADPVERQAAEQELRALKPQVPQLNADVQRLLAEETSLTQDIANEQHRWTDFNQRLEELERSLGRR